jgi:CheY-like chemotaxis protein
MHGGRVEAASSGLSLGSTFTVYLPLISSVLRPRADAAAGVRAPQRRVLIVDDNVDSAEMLGALLEMKGHTVPLAHDGPTAVSIGGDCAPEVVLLDIGLPGMDGYRVIRELRTMPRGRVRDHRRHHRLPARGRSHPLSRRRVRRAPDQADRRAADRPHPSRIGQLVVACRRRRATRGSPR